jgi:hypothetical protein
MSEPESQHFRDSVRHRGAKRCAKSIRTRFHLIIHSTAKTTAPRPNALVHSQPIDGQNASLYGDAVFRGQRRYHRRQVAHKNQTAAAAARESVPRSSRRSTPPTPYANSGIATRLRLVHVEQVAYDESGDFITDLNRLTTAGDGYMDNVPTLRNTYGADLVSLFVENAQYCGYSWVGPNANYAFSVVNRGCASGNLSFVHELGHNFGALHDPYVDSDNTPYAYGHGLTDPPRVGAM